MIVLTMSLHDLVHCGDTNYLAAVDQQQNFGQGRSMGSLKSEQACQVACTLQCTMSGAYTGKHEVHR